MDEPPAYSETTMPPLVKQTTVRITAPAYARVLSRSLVERVSEGQVMRRWLWRGALAEGIDLNSPL